MASKTEKWTTIGSVRGACGHKHRTLGAACDCARRDNAACKRTGGYSDRQAMPIGREMTADEMDERAAIMQGDL